MSNVKQGLLAVEGELTTDRINDCLRRLEQRSDTDLVLPTKPKIRSPLAWPQLLQLIVTWNQRSAADASLRTYLACADEQLRFRDQFHGLVAGLSSHPIRALNGDDITEQIKKLGAEKLAEHFVMARRVAPILDLPPGVDDHRETELPSRGPSTLFLCADGEFETDEMPFVYHLDNSSATVRPAYQFVRLLQMTFAHGRIGWDMVRIIKPDDSLFENLGVVCQELFKNTHGWARHDISGGVVPNGVRGVLVELIGGINDLRKMMPKEKSDPLLRYLDRRLTGQRHAAVAVSVFDSGPGLARRWLKRKTLAETSLAEEYDAVTACLQLHSTTSEVLGRGVGLHQVLVSLSDPSVRGFLFLRTGRMCLYRDLEAAPVTGGEALTPADYRLTDWTTESTGTPTDAGLAAGTLVTFVFPVPISP
jgi:hypothetical protein